MAKPFFSGNYGSALARVDTRPIVEAGKAQGQMYANLGKQVSGAIEQYGLNKEKRAKLTGEIEAYYKENPNAISEIGMSGDEAQDKKDFLEREKFIKGDMNMAQLEGLAGKLARGDVLKTKYAQDEARAIANEMGRVNLDITNQLKDTRINIEKDKGVLSDLATKLAVEINPEKKKLLQAQMSDAIKNFGLGDARRELEKETLASQADLLPLKTDAEEAKLKAVPGQVERQEELSELQVKAAKRADTSADLLLQAFGGAKGKADFDYQGVKLSRKSFEKGLEYLDAKIDYTNYLSTAKNVPVDTKKQYASLVSHSGKILDTRVEDPDTGNQITFQEYMEKANDDPDLYPLKGDGSGAAGVLYGNFQNAQKQIIDFGKTIQVQVDDGQGAGGSPAPTGSPINVRNMQPQQAMQALQVRIGEIRRQLPQLNAQQQQLGQPGQMTTTAFDTSPFGNINTPLAVRPQTIGDMQNSSIPQQRLDLMAELEQLEAKKTRTTKSIRSKIMAIRTMSLGEALENGYEVIGPDPIYREEATGFETATSIGLEVVPAILGGVFGGLVGGAGGSALGNYFSQQYRIGRGLQDDFGAGEFAAATIAGGIPLGNVTKFGTAGAVAARGAQGAAIAGSELAARTYIDEDRAPTQEEIATTLLFGGVFGGGLGAVEAKFLSDGTGVDLKAGMTRPEVKDALATNIKEKGGIENASVGNPLISQMNINQLINQKNTDEVAGEVLQGIENKLLKEADDTVQQLTSTQLGEEATGVMAGIQKSLDGEIAQQDEIFGGLNNEINIGVQRLGDSQKLREIDESIARLDHKLGKGKGAKKQRAKLAAEKRMVLKRNDMEGVLDLQSAMRGNQGGADQPTKAMNLKDRPMKQADPMSKVERMAEEKLGSNYEKFIKNVKQGMTRDYGLAVGAGGAATLGMLTNDEESDAMKAGFSPLVLALLFGSGIGARQLRKIKKTPEFKRANAQAKTNPTKVEPDAVKAEKVQEVADKGMYVRQNQFKKIYTDAKDFLSDTLVPLSRKLKNIDPILNAIFRSHEKDVNIKTRQFLDRVSPFVTTMSKRLKGNKIKLREFKTNLLNGDYNAIVRMTDDLGITDKSELNEMRKALNEVRDYAREEGGIEVGYIEDYFPRQVEDYKSFKKFLDENDDFRDTRNQVEQALEDYRVKHKYESVDLIPAEEAAEVTSRVLRGFPMQPGGALPGNFKGRSIKEVDDRMLDAYADPADALKNYIERAVMATERKKFLFRKPSDQGKQVGFEGSTDRIGADLGMKMEVDESLAGQVAKRMLQGDKKYTAEDIEKLREIIQSRFSGKTVSPFIQGVKNLNYMQVMGNFGSAITQLGDLAYSIHFNGFDNTFRSLFNNKENFDFVKHFNLKDHNIDSATSTDGLSKALDKVFTVVGLKKLDQLAKNTTMNASWRKYKAQAKRDAPGLRDELTPVFGSERAGQMVKELQDSNPASKQLPKAVEELIWYKFLDLNPATLGEMPKFYNESGNMRIMYMLKTFTIKQFDVAREAGFEDIRKATRLYKDGKKAESAKLAAKGMKGLIGLATVFAAANAGTDMIKDTLYGRPIKRDELFENNLWKLIGINRYLVMKAQRDGPAKAFLEGLLPPTTAFDRAAQDISAIAGDKEYKGAMLQGTPLDMVYWKYLGGLDKIKNSN